MDQDDLILAFDNHNFSMNSAKQQSESKFHDLFFSQYQEGPIEFKPTYKLVIRTQDYDTSKK